MVNPKQLLESKELKHQPNVVRYEKKMCLFEAKSLRPVIDKRTHQDDIVILCRHKLMIFVVEFFWDVFLR